MSMHARGCFVLGCLALVGCATTRTPREVALDDCRTRVGRELGFRYDSSMGHWIPQIGAVSRSPGVPIPGLRERLNACMAARGIWNVPHQYQGNLRFESGTVLPIRVWLVSSPGAPWAGSYRTANRTYGDFRLTFEGERYRGSLDASDGSRCDVRGDTDEARTRLAGTFVCSAPESSSGTLDLRRP